MRQSIFKERFFVFFFVCLSVFVVTLLGCLFLLLKIEDREVSSTKKAYSDYLLADELRQTSDDLTKMVRLYVLTADPKYAEWYHEILRIRSGLSPTPENYHEIYWDLIFHSKDINTAKGKTISLKKRIQDAGFPPIEENFLLEGEVHSNHLAEMEQEAIYAMKGKFKNASGFYSIQGHANPQLAAKLVSEEEYMRQKAEVMQSLQQFYEHFDQRIKEQTDDLATFNKSVIFLSMALLVAIAFFMVRFLHKALRSLNLAAESNEHLLLSALPPAISEKIQQGKGSHVSECEACVLFLDVGVEGELTKKDAEALQLLYAELDHITEIYHVERIRTVQETYMVASGISGKEESAAEQLADFMLAAKQRILEWEEKYHSSFYFKAGMASGTVIAGILDQKKYLYDLWGDVLKVASHLESNGVKNEIQITKKLASALKGFFETEEKEGEEKVYFLRGRIN
ncbi:MAG: adenylate/guanylate cyclase domain-containing protein [Rhabdochlamydiaceae bacterium]|nr:adenylate/guanylate cyclase domain-containing protein [Rhabdochlamydiaceae bacterium]